MKSCLRAKRLRRFPNLWVFIAFFLATPRAWSTVQIVNDGIPGQNSNEVAARLNADLRKFHPQVVVIFVGMNDAVNEKKFLAPDAMLRTPRSKAAIAVLVHPQPHPGVVPHEHNAARGVGKNGGESAIDGATFLSTIGWDWLVAVRDRDTGIWLPITLSTTGSSMLGDAFVTSDLSPSLDNADIKIAANVKNLESKSTEALVQGTIVSPEGKELSFQQPITLSAGESKTASATGDLSDYKRRMALAIRIVVMGAKEVKT